MLKDSIDYLTNNPKGYWFKAKLYGWGWTPVTWQGWLTIAVFMGLMLLDFYRIDRQSHSASDTLILFIPQSFVLVAILVYICYKTGEKPRWQWGLKNKKMFGRIKKTSERNGEIDVLYLFGKASIFVNGFDQSSSYIHAMWREALQHIPQSFSPKRILMLGLGGGSAITELRRRFDNPEITAVEWDPVMINIYQEIHATEEPITILEGDASVLVPLMHTSFDLVIVDLFKGNVTPKKLRDDAMIQSLVRVTSPQGYCLLNAFVSLDLLPVFDAHFLQKEQWKYRYNTLLLYSP